MTDFEKFTEEQYGLYHSVIRSIRYHDRREGFYNTLYDIVLFIALVSACITLLYYTNKELPIFKAISFIAIFVMLFFIVVDWKKSANQHNILKRKFIDLQINILDIINAESEDDPRWAQCERTRLEIEKDEPPVYRALNELCYLETNIAEGIKPEEDENHVEVKWYQRLTAHLLKWENIAIK